MGPTVPICATYRSGLSVRYAYVPRCISSSLPRRGVAGSRMHFLSTERRICNTRSSSRRHARRSRTAYARKCRDRSTRCMRCRALTKRRPAGVAGVRRMRALRTSCPTPYLRKTCRSFGSPSSPMPIRCGSRTHKGSHGRFSKALDHEASARPEEHTCTMKRQQGHLSSVEDVGVHRPQSDRVFCKRRGGCLPSSFCG